MWKELRSLCVAFILSYSYHGYVSVWQDLEAEADALNNTKNADCQQLFFNRVPKVGSQSLMNLVNEMSVRNNFTAYKDNTDNVKLYGERTLNLLASDRETYYKMFRDDLNSEAAVYSKHTNFMDFREFAGLHHFIYVCSLMEGFSAYCFIASGRKYKQPIYMNIVRDPVERVISWYYYIRAPWYIFNRNGTLSVRGTYYDSFVIKTEQNCTCFFSFSRK